MKKPVAKKSILKTILSGIAKPITVPLGWLKRDISGQATIVKSNFDKTLNRSRGVFADIYEKSGASENYTGTGLSIDKLTSEDKRLNLAAYKNRWILFTSAYIISMLTFIYVAASGGNPLILVCTLVWACLFFAKASRYAWASVRTAQNLVGVDSFISQKNWLLKNWSSNLPLPPAYATEITADGIAFSNSLVKR